MKFDLLQPEIEDQFARSPMSLYKAISSKSVKPDWIFLDEIQKVPKLLNVVHKAIEELKVKFILTGSSARKLKRGAANLLAGRAFLNSMYPFTYFEIKNGFDLTDTLQWGSLPQIYNISDEADRKSYLRSYSAIYMKEEVKEEQLVRRIDPFRNFLDVAAQMSGKILNFKKIGDEVGVDHKTTQSYFDILSDTWLGFYLPAFHQSIRKGQRLSPKFYFFDVGVKNSLSDALDSRPAPGTSYYGELFEHWFICEIFRYNDYFQKDFRISYLQTKNGTEIDLILSKGRYSYAIEIKSNKQVDNREVAKLKKISGDIKNLKDVFYISTDPTPKLIDGVHCLPWADFFTYFRDKM